jgi:GMP synthase-like glutamine amidotransferase
MPTLSQICHHHPRVILFVDNEHESTHDKPEAHRLLAARTRISYRLEDLTGDTCLLQRYRNVTPELIDRLGIRGVFISGHGAEASAYDEGDRVGLREVIAAGVTPVFGFCGGLQFMGETLGTPLERIGRIPDDEDDPYPQYQPGWRKEVGYFPVRSVAEHALLDGLGSEPVFRHAHTWHLPEPPSGFVTLASTELTSVQLVVHESLPLAGSQFHPEYWTEEHPDGETLIANFCRWAGLI